MPQPAQLLDQRLGPHVRRQLQHRPQRSGRAVQIRLGEVGGGLVGAYQELGVQVPFGGRGGLGQLDGLGGLGGRLGGLAEQ